MTIISKLFEIQKMNLSVEKDGVNPHFKSNYITLDNLVSVLQPICNELGLLIAHKTEGQQVVTTIHDTESGENISSYFPIGDISNPQKIGSCITYSKRYNLCQIFNIITDQDDDANKASIPNKQSFTDDDMDKLATAMKGDKPPFKNAKEAIEAIKKTRSLTTVQETTIEVLLS